MILRNKMLVLIGEGYFAVDQLVLSFNVLEHKCSFVLEIEKLTFGFIGVQDLAFELFVLVKKILDLIEVFVDVFV